MKCLLIPCHLIVFLFLEKYKVVNGSCTITSPLHLQKLEGKQWTGQRLAKGSRINTQSLQLRFCWLNWVTCFTAFIPGVLVPGMSCPALFPLQANVWRRKCSVESSVMHCNLEKLDMGYLTESILNVLAAPAFGSDCSWSGFWGVVNCVVWDVSWSSSISDKKQAMKLSEGSSQLPHSALHPSLGSWLAAVWVRASLVRWSHSLELLSDVGWEETPKLLPEWHCAARGVCCLIGKELQCKSPSLLHPSFLHLSSMWGKGKISMAVLQAWGWSRDTAPAEKGFDLSIS